MDIDLQVSVLSNNEIGTKLEGCKEIQGLNAYHYLSSYMLLTLFVN